MFLLVGGSKGMDAAEIVKSSAEAHESTTREIYLRSRMLLVAAGVDPTAKVQNNTDNKVT
jgi:hypothetical protein